jgi:formylglycine-generating enzyme required for sulfatase activity
MGKSVALLIGVEEYENPDISRLRYAVKDVTAVGQLLEKSLGYQTVRVLTSGTADARLKPTNVNVFKALDSLAAEIGQDDTFLLYFSGHGFSKDGQGFLGSINVDPLSIETLQVSSVPVATLQNKLKRIKARQIILIMDACRNDPEAGKGDGDNKLTVDFAKSLGVVAKAASETGGGSAVLFACSEGERAFEEPRFEHSVFTHFLLQGLNGKAASLSLDDVTAYTAGEVAKWAQERGKKQSPDAIKFGTGKLTFKTLTALRAPEVVIPVVTLAPTAIRLELQDIPTGAKVTVDDRVLQGTVYMDEIAEKTKDVEVSISAAGYRPYVSKVTLVRGTVSNLRVTMERKSERTESPVKPVSSNKLSDYPALRAYVEALRPIPSGGIHMSGIFRFNPPNKTQNVRLTAFRMGATPVTTAVWREYCTAMRLAMPKAPWPNWHFEEPIVGVSWNDIMGKDGTAGFCEWASNLAGFRLTLPTEAQWEYGARGGRLDTYPWGNKFATSKLWCSINKDGDVGRTSSVYRTWRIFRNVYGLSDMAGNVWEFCSDYFAEYNGNLETDPVGPPASKKGERCLRGGSWYDRSEVFKCAYRSFVVSSKGYVDVGFRLVAPPK